MENYNCVLHGQILERLQETLGVIDGKLSDIRVEVAGTTAQLKQMNGSVMRVTKQVDDHETWLKNIQSALDTAKGFVTGSPKWLGLIMFLSNALAATVTFIVAKVFKQI